ncbi:putative uncharacterized protein YGR160W [Papaver somniferum]|uniref:putative uncharacterized protein YGR160W n=1 Tax=Papaver somniferum TaxID=3469 RepID=UPI000E6FD7B8|nr:putative uncharacterized protein YGR160W [Papaver somniferum]
MSLISGGESDTKFTASISSNTSERLFQKKEDDVSDSCQEEYESDDDIVYFSSSCTLEIKGDTDDSEDEDEPEDADGDEDSEDDEGTDLDFDSCRPSKQEEPSQEAVDKLEEIRSFMPAGMVKTDELYYIDIHGYIGEGYGGYGIVIRNSSKEP